DMHGNVMEWCLDTYSSYGSDAITDPFVTGGSGRVFRGGSWAHSSDICRSAGRYAWIPSNSNRRVGFRVVLAPNFRVRKGYQFNGPVIESGAGTSVSPAGDVTGDGVGDLIIGAHWVNGQTGVSYLISGADLAALDAASGVVDGIIQLADVASIGTSYQFNGAFHHDLSGQCVSSAGDVTGDGIDDLLIGATYAKKNSGIAEAGKTYLISGADLSALDAASGAIDGIIQLADVAAIGTSYEFEGAGFGNHIGHSASSAGDMTGDGVADLIIGSSNSNLTYLISGADLATLDAATANYGTAGDGTIELSNVAATGTSYQFNGINHLDRAGFSVSSGADMTNDGINDLIIGAPSADPNGVSSGQIYLISGADLTALDTASGGVDGIIQLANVTVSGTSSYQFNGPNPGDLAGFSASLAGDVTNDGIGDLIIGAPSADPNGLSSGQIYLISGADLTALDGASGVVDGIIELGDFAASSTSYQFNGEAVVTAAGWSVSGVGDVTGDGTDDLLIGESGNWGSGSGGPVSQAGVCYLISGADLALLDAASGAVDGIIELTDVASTGTSYKLSGFATNDLTGDAVSGAGDLTGDGVNDLLIGAPNNVGEPSSFLSPGKCFLISGADLALFDSHDGTTDGVINLNNIRQ
ncbi:MAG: SUMF1/EgtB/PvdO family nonheme iron enzyme, partial [bacterium]|nr:SUMF1/EgtB/PvdO family nonheme iron enzyme [bacterium]